MHIGHILDDVDDVALLCIVVYCMHICWVVHYSLAQRSLPYLIVGGMTLPRNSLYVRLDH